MKTHYQFPIIIEQDEDGFLVAECPTFSGCYSQGKSLPEVLKNIEEVIKICLQEKESKTLLKTYPSSPRFIFSTVSI